MAERSGPCAAVDVGTQSTRLLISDGRRDLRRIATVTHLGAGVATSGQLGPDRVAATLEVLRGYRALMEDHGVVSARAITTAVVRNSAEPDHFLAAASEALGFPLELVSGEEEGALAFQGATARLPHGASGPAGSAPLGGSSAVEPPFVTVDLGGGSTEFAVGTDRCEAVVSVPFGATALTEAYLTADPPRPEELVAALSIAEVHLDDVVRDVPLIADARTFVGLGGTFTTVVALELGMADYDRERVNGFTLTREAAEDVFRTVVTEPLADRLHNPGLPATRGRTILGGACAVVAIMRFFGLDTLRVSDNDLLDGIIDNLVAAR